MHLLKNILYHLDLGLTPENATVQACEEMTNRVGDTAGAITVSKNGTIGIGFTSNKLAWAYQKSGEVHFGIKHGDDYVEPA